MFLWTNYVSAQNLTIDYCRNKADENEMVLCIEQNVFDPCDAASSGEGWWTAQCAWAHLKIAEKQMNVAEKTIVSRLQQAKVGNPKSEWDRVQKSWREYRDSYCKLSSSLYDVGGFDGETLGYCLRRLTELRVKELDNLISHDK
jgi:uncharacterized protein YecT (DUF1311 family)